MFNYPLDFAYGRRLDNIDYERMGVLDIWYVRNTIILLTSFEMEIKGYFSRPDHKYCYERVYHKFRTYVHNCLMNKEFKYDDGLDDDAREQNKAEGMIGFDLDDACFYKNDILGNISKNIKTLVNVDLLEEFLSGSSEHIIPIVYKFDKELDSSASDGNHDTAKQTPDDLGVKGPPDEAMTSTTDMSDNDKIKLTELQDLRKKVAELSAEKVKWDASIEAAARVSLLFMDQKLEKPVTKAVFIKEFKEHLGAGLPDSTIEKIYKNLPTEYKLKGGRPKKTADSDSNDPIDVTVKAAVYAGSIFDTDDHCCPANS